MDITLRKANAIQDSIRDAINSIKIILTIDINEFQNVEDMVNTAKSTAFANDERRTNLLSALYNIRGLVGQANAASGINLKLSEAAFIDKRISQLDDFKRASPQLDISVIKGKLEKISKTGTESRRTYLDESEVRTSIVSQEEIDQSATRIQALKKQKQKINDEVLTLNISTTITLSDEVVKTLTAEGIL